MNELKMFEEPILPKLRVAEVIAQPFGTFINADCLSVMKGFSDKQFDLAIVDVPYGINVDESMAKDSNTQRGKSATKRGFYEMKDWDKTAPTKAYWNELERISKNQIVWGANHFISLWPFDTSCWIVWDKDNGDNGYADCELAWTSFNTAVRKFKWKWQGMLQQNMKDKQQRIHPTEKPVQLYEWLLRNYAKPGDSIIDTHLGSASIGIAVDKVNKLDHMNLTLTGIELDSYYFKKSMSRLNEHSSQTAMSF